MSLRGVRRCIERSMTIIREYQAIQTHLDNVDVPLIISNLSVEMKSALIEKGYQFVSLNKILSKRLLEKDKESRTVFVSDDVIDIINECAGNIFLTDYEMLFDPRYEIEVISLFCKLARSKRVVILWCGKFRNGQLTYAEPGCADYYSCSLEKYPAIYVN